MFCATAGTLHEADGAEDLSCIIRLVDVTGETGIQFQHTNGGTGNRYIVESVVAGLALFDYDNDGWIDIYFLNGAALPETVVGELPRNALYRNNGDWTFTDVTEQAGVGDLGYGLGVAVADYDNDGMADLYVNNFGLNRLYRNLGDGTFRDVSHEARLARETKVRAGACFLDMDRDGDLDLYSANYVDFNYDNHIVRMIGPHQFHPGPKDYRGVPDDLFRNNGDGTFTNVAQQAGIAALASTGMGVIALDYDEDGDSDVFVCNDAAPNFLFQNDGRGKFNEVALAAGVAFDLRGNANSSMGVDCADYDNDGHLDLFMTSFSNESPVLYRNIGQGLFEDTTNRAGVGIAAFRHVNWGTGFVDFDHDGDRDLFISNGHFMDNIRYIDDRTSVNVANVLLMNSGDARFVDVSDRCGNGLAAVASSRGAAFDDLDNDGDVDVVVLNANNSPNVMRNESKTAGHWLQLKLLGVNSNRAGVGARVEVVAGSLGQVAEVHSGRGYQSHYGTTLHFGLGKHDQVDRITVRWPSGPVRTYKDILPDRIVVLSEFD
jgi:hypothetical protein